MKSPFYAGVKKNIFIFKKKFYKKLTKKNYQYPPLPPPLPSLSKKKGFLDTQTLQLIDSNGKEAGLEQFCCLPVYIEIVLTEGIILFTCR